MGQKVNPHGLRVGVIKDWDSRWYARNDKVGDLIVEDYNIRRFLKKTLYSAGVPKIEIERDSNKVRIYIHCSRPGVVIGKGGAEIEKLQAQVSKMIGKPVALSIVEVRTPDTNAQLVAENIASQLEKRIGFQRAHTPFAGGFLDKVRRIPFKNFGIEPACRLGQATLRLRRIYAQGKEENEHPKEGLFHNPTPRTYFAGKSDICQSYFFLFRHFRQNCIIIPDVFRQAEQTFPMFRLSPRPPSPRNNGKSLVPKA